MSADSILGDIHLRGCLPDAVPGLDEVQNKLLFRREVLRSHGTIMRTRLAGILNQPLQGFTHGDSVNLG